MKTSKRYLLTLITGCILLFLACISTFKEMEVVASACIAGTMTILTTYIWGETKRPSNSQNNEADTN